MRKFSCLTLGLAFLLVSSQGCGSNVKPTNKVKGVVYHHDKPMPPIVMVIFYNQEDRVVAASFLDKDGSYELGAPKGDVKICVTTQFFQLLAERMMEESKKKKEQAPEGKVPGKGSKEFNPELLMAILHQESGGWLVKEFKDKGGLPEFKDAPFSKEGKQEPVKALAQMLPAELKGLELTLQTLKKVGQASDPTKGSPFEEIHKKYGDPKNPVDTYTVTAGEQTKDMYLK